MSVICPYCGNEAQLVDSAKVYSRSFGMMYRCEPCDSYVGCHKGTTKPLGGCANAETRAARKLAHAAFDPLWKNRRIFRHRSDAYRWLSEQLGVSKENCHIAMFDAEQCRKVVEASTTIDPTVRR